MSLETQARHEVTVDLVTSEEGVERLIAPVVLAFGADPFVRWMLPDSSQFLAYFAKLTRLHGQRTAATGGAYALGDGRAAAFWYPPDVEPERKGLRATFRDAGVLERVAEVWEQAASFEPAAPHWYLRQIGVDPALQGHGQGSALLAAGLAEIDRRAELAYLEATSTPSRAFYERHGFSVLGEVQVRDSAPLWPMLRKPV